MDAQFALAGKDFVISVTDKKVARSIVTMKHNEDKTYELTPHTIISVSGEAGDTANFSEYIQGNIRLYSIRNSQDLTPSETANFIRGELASALRSRRPYQVNLLVTGFDKTTGEASLYWIDYLSAMSKIPYAAHGYCSYFLYAVMDREYSPDITQEQGLEIVKKCFAALKMRFLVDFPEYTIKVVDSNGVREISMSEL
ncbi:Proteasome subunit beta type-4 [Coemansia sp. RSA 1807]|nr:Proteasome subunit beta type-4 [Coemansia sp. RSA 1591]KAJ1767574.1 Proteasome subunit beta type-4 [Coemansia sp. RSA 1752]KAJ1790046.1 Proteasome subunit beta type-4 [Coemansia sp. RSA 2167]KAJ1794907.1 Proteasome subunit beta type-4 [Coemansia sp. RSA 1938]KAJ2133836.1 Proteasome subunit beta type-4 [Coemansia sp. RSA 788]KAJ2144914.1 Proteasome subunit beta type-4 [Coemansia sp. RSA 564]KAJ2151521.1 Proteasome subunit beta type-4 [Coemansia sp. RSA 637]KAJ2167116.1 Proteasome subunit b